jgi:hypothetical protein
LTHNLIRKTTEKPKTKFDMKKIIYVLLFAISSALVISSCTEEEVAPVSETTTGGTGASGGAI